MLLSQRLELGGVQVLQEGNKVVLAGREEAEEAEGEGWGWGAQMGAYSSLMREVMVWV